MTGESKKVTRTLRCLDFLDKIHVLVSTLLFLCCNVKYYQTICVWTHLWIEWLFQQHRRGYIVPLSVMLSTVDREKWRPFLREHKTLRVNSWSRGSEVFCLQVHYVFYVYCQCTVYWSALLEKTTMTVNKRTAVGIQPTCHFAEARRKATPNMHTAWHSV